jgi:hypothetical protein
MKPRLSRGRAVATAAVTAGLVLAVAVPAGAAVQLQSQSPASSVKIAKQAKLKAGGAGAVVTYVVTCNQGAMFDLYASISEVVGGKTTGGTVSFYSQECTGSAQKVKVGFTAYPLAFRAGTAFTTVTVEPGYQSNTLRAQREITLAS